MGEQRAESFRRKVFEVLIDVFRISLFKRSTRRSRDERALILEEDLEKLRREQALASSALAAKDASLARAEDTIRSLEDQVNGRIWTKTIMNDSTSRNNLTSALRC